MDLDPNRIARIVAGVLENKAEITRLEKEIEALISKYGGTADEEAKTQIFSELIPLAVEHAARKGERTVTLLRDVKHKAGEPNSAVWACGHHSDENKLEGMSRSVFLMCKEKGLHPQVRHWENFDPCRSDYGWELIVCVYI